MDINHHLYSVLLAALQNNAGVIFGKAEAILKFSRNGSSVMRDSRNAASHLWLLIDRELHTVNSLRTYIVTVLCLILWPTSKRCMHHSEEHFVSVFFMNSLFCITDRYLLTSQRLCFSISVCVLFIWFL